MTGAALRRIVLVSCALLLAAAPAFAQETAPAADRTAPVVITADTTLEWNRVQKTYTARGNAVARQGPLQVSSDTLTAHYSGAGDSAGGIGSEIDKMTATGRVEIASPPYTAYGDKAVYDLVAGLATLTGEKLRIETPTEKLTARDRIEFDTNKNSLSALGAATARRGTDSVTSETLVAFFAQEPDGRTALQRIVADRPVTIRTARETVTGDSGIYDVANGTATLRGRVRILQGENWLEGTRAEIDLNTGISRLFGDTPAAPLPAADSFAPPAAPVGDGRVRGVFYPKKQEPEAPSP